MTLISKGLSKGRRLLGQTPIGGVAVRVNSRRYKACLPSVEEARAELMSLSPRPTSMFCRDFSYQYPASVDVSVIVPCYNVERYVGECINSVLSQEAPCTFEVIAVNDGSKDNTLQILEHFAANDHRVSVISQDNRGFSGARNTGINNARGRALMFVDSDDVLLPQHIANLWSALAEGDADFISGRYRKLMANGKVLDSVEKQRLHGGPWARLYQRRIWDDIRFPEGFWFEDTVQAYCIDSRFRNRFVPDSGYCYRLNSGSITNTSKASYKSLDSYWIIEEMIEWCRRLGIELGQELYDQTLRQLGPLLLYRTSILNDEQRVALFVLASNLINETEEFRGLKTDLKGRWFDVESSLRDGDYSKWIASCRWAG